MAEEEEYVLIRGGCQIPAMQIVMDYDKRGAPIPAMPPVPTEPQPGDQTGTGNQGNAGNQGSGGASDSSGGGKKP